MTMTEYNDIEIQTAKNLLERGYKWIVRDKAFYGNAVFAHKEKPYRVEGRWMATLACRTVCTDEVPIFNNIHFDDKEPVSLESVVHPQILDDVEKQYLKGVIRPFRNRVWYIMKSFAVDKANCYIFIRFNDGSGDMNFSVFSKSDMYKGMKICKAYTPEELGLV